jgi:hypothetical protein
VKPEDLMALCRSATRPLLLQLDDSFYPVLTQKMQLQKRPATQGRQLVTVEIRYGVASRLIARGHACQGSVIPQGRLSRDPKRV